MSQVEAFSARVDVKYRVLIPYNETRRVLLHCQLKNDASFYLIESQPKEILFGESIIRNGKGHVNITEGNLENTPSVLNDSHLSFHGTGAVKSPVNRAIGPQLVGLKDMEQLCFILSPHPTKLPSVSKSRKSDITIEYPIDEDCPLAVNIYASPRHKMTHQIVPVATFQWSYAFLYEHFFTSDDLVILFHFYHSPGKWPVHKVFTYLADARQLEYGSS